MPFVRSSSRQLIDVWRSHSRSSGTDPSPDVVGGADAAAGALRDDCERWGRLGAGAVAYLGAVIGVFILATTIQMLVDGARLESMAAVDWIVFGGLGCLALAVVVVSLWVLIRLWRSGRMLSRAAAWWMRLPYRVAGRARVTSGWFSPRLAQFEPRIFVRIASCSLLFLVAVFGFSAPFMPGAWAMPTMPIVMIAVGAISALCLCGQMGGVMNITAGLSEQDPLWVRLRAAFRRG